TFRVPPDPHEHSGGCHFRRTVIQASPPPGDRHGLAWMRRCCGWAARAEGRNGCHSHPGDERTPARGTARVEPFQLPGSAPAPGRGSVWAVSELWVPVVSPALLFVRHAGESH